MTTLHLAIVGPTASGKSALALEVARAFGDVEIVSVDSMQVYRGLDIGTAKPTAAERSEIPHHLIDVADPGEEWSVARFQHEARAAVADIEQRGKRALLVGGTGLYVQAVIDPLTFPPEDRAARDAILADASTPDGLAAAYAELTDLDPAAAAKIDRANVRRIARALEVIRITGCLFSSFGAGAGIQEFGPPVFPVRIAGLWLPRVALAVRIEQRFARMRDAGLVEEVRALVAAGPLSRTARQAIGYHEVLDFLAGAEPSLDAALDAAVVRTRQFARRQRMWFRRDPRVQWFGAAANPCPVLPALLASWNA